MEVPFLDLSDDRTEQHAQRIARELVEELARMPGQNFHGRRIDLCALDRTRSEPHFIRGSGQTPIIVGHINSITPFD